MQQTQKQFLISLNIYRIFCWYLSDVQVYKLLFFFYRSDCSLKTSFIAFKKRQLVICLSKCKCDCISQSLILNDNGIIAS